MYKCLIYSQDDIYTKSILHCIEEAFPGGQKMICQDDLEIFNLIQSDSIDLALVDLESFEDYEKSIEFISILASNDIDYITFFYSDNVLRDIVSNEAFYFFLKPFSCSHLLKKLSEWTQLKNQKDTALLEVECLEGAVTIPVKNIYYFEKIDRLVKIRTKSKFFYTKESLKTLCTKVDNRFYNTHQSYIVNTEKIHSVINGDSRPKRIKFMGLKDEALLSRYKLKEFNAFLTSH